MRRAAAWSPSSRSAAEAAFTRAAPVATVAADKLGAVRTTNTSAFGHAAAPERHRAHRLVGGDDDVGAGVGRALAQAHQPVEQATPAELRLEHLGPQVVHVVDDAHAQELPRPRHQEEEVGRIAEVEDAEPMPSPRLPQQARLAQQRRRVLGDEAEQAGRLAGDPVAVDVDALELLFRLDVAAHARADHGHLVAAVAQRARLLPHPPVERHRQVLDHDQDRRTIRGSYQQRPS